MAFNVATFTTRALTAIVFALVMLAGLFLSRWGFIILFTIIHFGCWYDYIRLAKKINPNKSLYFFLLGLLYITVPVLLMLRLAFSYNGDDWFYSYVLPCIIIFSIWINDTMAYIIGSLIGRTKLSPISPKKTWEGTIAGILFCVSIISLLGWQGNLLSLKNRVIISAICAVFGTLGDLLESKLKRIANVKDSGSLMPGHGGFLDRFDSLLIATPFVWLYVYLFIDS